jgi:hypothetical protein
MHPVKISEDGEVVVDTSEILVRKSYAADQVVPPVCGAEFCAADVDGV